MNCADFEQGLARLLAGEAIGNDGKLLTERLREHAASCAGCHGSGDLLQLLELPAAEREIADDPGEEYWSTFEDRLRPRLRVPERSRGRWWAAAAAVLLLALVAGWLLGRPGEPGTGLVVDAGSPPGSKEASRPELPPSLVRSLDAATPAEVEDELAALEELGAGWGSGGFDAEDADPAIWDGGLFPEFDRLDSETRRRLLDWLRDQNRSLEGA